MRSYCVAQRNLLSVTWQPGWEGSWGRMDTRICVTESLYCSPETITTLLIGYFCCLLQYKIKCLKKKKKEAYNFPPHCALKRVMCLCSISDPVESFGSHYNLVNWYSGFIHQVIVTVGRNSIENRFLDPPRMKTRLSLL